MIQLGILRDAHDEITRKLLGEQARLGRGLTGHKFWRERQTEAFALPTFAADSIQDSAGNFVTVLDSSPLDGQGLV